MIENITKKNGNIAFVEDTHKYFDITNPEAVFTSVTTLIHNYVQEFDKDFWASYKALEKLLNNKDWISVKKELLNTKKFNKELLKKYNISEENFNEEFQGILNLWEVESKKSCERGTKIHAELENSFYKNNKDIDISKFEIGGKFVCEKDRTELDLENAVYPEYLISNVSNDKKLRIAGQIDLLVKKGNNITIVDYKGLPLETKIPTPSGWSTIGELQEGDYVFNNEGNPVKILHKSEVHYNPCYKITFDNGTSIVADHEHRWLVNNRVMTTEEMFNSTEELIIYNTDPIKLEEKDIDITDFKDDIIPIEYLRSSISQREKLLRSIMDKKSYYKDGYFVIQSSSSDIVSLIASLGLVPIRCEEGIKFSEKGYRTVVKIEPTETVATQCLEVETNTFLCTEEMIVTHNTNKEIKTKSFFDNKTKKSVMMKYPLNNLEDCNYNHYCLQLSTYAWMLQEHNPDFKIDDLILIHFDHNDNTTIYHLPYLKDDVIRMLNYFKKEFCLKDNKEKRKRIEY